jgi:hypothetical protein
MIFDARSLLIVALVSLVVGAGLMFRAHFADGFERRAKVSSYACFLLAALALGTASFAGNWSVESIAGTSARERIDGRILAAKNSGFDLRSPARGFAVDGSGRRTVLLTTR